MVEGDGVALRACLAAPPSEILSRVPANPRPPGAFRRNSTAVRVRSADQLQSVSTHRLRKVFGNVADVLPFPLRPPWKRWLGAVTRVPPQRIPPLGSGPPARTRMRDGLGATTASACALQSYYAVLGTYRTDAPLMIRLLNREPTVMCDALVPLTNKNAKYGTRHERRRSNAAICARRNEQCVKLRV